MDTIRKYLSKIIVSRVCLYRDDAIHSNDAEDAKNSLKKFSVLLISSQYLIEVRHFFKITKRTELKEAAKIYAQNNAPFASFEYWLDYKKAEGGYFVNIYYIAKSKYEELSALLEGGGVLLPEATVTKELITPNTKLLLESGSYDIDLSDNLFYQAGNSVLDELLNEKAQIKFDNILFAEKLRDNFKFSHVLNSLDKIFLTKKNTPAFSIGNALALFGVLATYLALSSGYLYLENQNVVQRFEENKSNLQNVSRTRAELEQLQQFAVALNEPFKTYSSKTQLLEALSAEGVHFELTSLVVNGSDTSIRGESLSATKLFKELSSNPYFSSVRYKTPVRQIGAKDIFSIGLEVKQ